MKKLLIVIALVIALMFPSLSHAAWTNSSNPARAKRAKALLAWADAVWDFVTQEQLNQMAGKPTYTTVDQLIAALPKITA